jgi:2-polyprenyl-3-methyl-5-hydroxy-6-metoxy-1,4-benzoquinol methylase
MSAKLAERANAGLHGSLLSRLPTALTPDSPILDVGCGTGAWLSRLQEAGYRNLHGLDLDTRQSANAGISIQQADLNAPAWPELPGPFALITAIEVIEHIENVGNFLDNLETHLADDGAVIITTPNVESIASRLRFLVLNELKQFDTIGDPTHIFPVLTHTLPRFLARRRLHEVERWGFPDDGTTITSRGAVNLAASVLRVFLPEPNKGDNLCLILRKRGDSRRP